MGCSNCTTCDASETKRCGTSSVFNWLYQIESTNENHKKLIEVQFKGDRKDFYINKEELTLFKGDSVVVEGEKNGHDVGIVTMQGELVALQIKRKARDLNKDPLKKLYRKASKKDLEKQNRAIKKEKKVLERARKIILNHNLEMKLSDVEYQGDETKATFYYIAEKRVDFRQLIKEYSREFNVRVEMKHIGVRQEAAKTGGVGVCGRELCCSTWMTNFPSVSTSAARYQQLAINPQKISGQCGRLKCCLNFELDSYTEGLKNFPNNKTTLKTIKGEARCFKIDVFKQKMYYYYMENPTELIEIDTVKAKEIILLNKKGKKPKDLEK